MDNIRALIVDDSSVMRKIVERSLRQAGLSLAQALEAGNGAEALAAVQNNKVDLILCDINMPVMDGLEFVKQLSGIENAKGIPVVMITTEGSEGHVVQALSAGARGYIRKPFTPDQVKEHVLPCLRGSHEYSDNLFVCRCGPRLLASHAAIVHARGVSAYAGMLAGGDDRAAGRRWSRHHIDGGTGGTTLRHPLGAVQCQLSLPYGLSHAGC